MSGNGDRDRGFQELKHHVKEEYDRGENGVVGDAHRPGSFGDGEFRTNKVDEDVKDGRGQLVRGQFAVQAPQIQPQGSLVHWERFLNVRSIKVMIVENDDSTRHIVTALLRNCNYEVIEAANGLQAWKILEDLTNHVDIVLTEVSMPLLSGVSLLCKIMSHNTRKNIPVIMMSSHDSMGLVFKCLSKGAVDFLVKPIRKNELKNLWQHVWRKCHSSSGSGSESGTQTQKSVKSKGSERSGRNSDSNNGDDDESNGLDTGDGSDDGSGTQSSWTKEAVEVDSSRAASQWDQKAECQDSTCGQVIRSNVELPGTMVIHGQEQLDNVAKGKELVIGKSRHSMVGECSSHKHKAVGPKMPEPQRDDGEFEALREPANLEMKNYIPDDPTEGAVIELSLKRLREVKDTDRAVQYDRNVLRHSELSAFSRYDTTTNASNAPSRILRSSSQHDNRSDITKKESMCDVRSHSDGYVNLSSNRGGNNMNVRSTGKLHVNPVVLKDKSEVTFAIKSLHHSSAFRPIKADTKTPSQQVGPAKTIDMKTVPNGILDPPRDPHHELPIQHIHHHHHVHHYHDMDGDQQSLSNPDDTSLKNLAADASHCGSSNVFGGPVVEGVPGNYSLNRSASGSKHGSNGQNSSTAVNAGGANMETVVGLAPKNGKGDDSGSGSGSGNGMDQSKSAQREAALIKFRQKRKERCFQKKVRYQNRKRLAEQRPRVRGQFVRQTGDNNDNSSSAADS